MYAPLRWDRSCRSNTLSHPVTVNWHRDNQPYHWPLTLGAGQGSHQSTNSQVTGMTGPGRAGGGPGVCRFRCGRPTTRSPWRSQSIRTLACRLLVVEYKPRLIQRYPLPLPPPLPPASLNPKFFVVLSDPSSAWVQSRVAGATDIEASMSMVWCNQRSPLTHKGEPVGWSARASRGS